MYRSAANPKIQKSHHEIRNEFDCQNSKAQTLPQDHGFFVWSMDALGFGFISTFDIRISSFVRKKTFKCLITDVCHSAE